MRDREPWHESENPTRFVWGFSWRTGGMILLIMLVCGGLSWAGWAFKVAMSDTKGRGDTIIKNNDVENRTKAQQYFYDLHAAVERNAANIGIAEATVAKHPNDRIAQQNLDGAVQMCVSSVADYNAQTQKILSRDWKDPNLPFHLDAAELCKKKGSN